MSLFRLWRDLNIAYGFIHQIMIHVMFIKKTKQLKSTNDCLMQVLDIKGIATTVGSSSNNFSTVIRYRSSDWT